MTQEQEKIKLQEAEKLVRDRLNLEYRRTGCNIPSRQESDTILRIEYHMAPAREDTIDDVRIDHEVSITKHLEQFALELGINDPVIEEDNTDEGGKVFALKIDLSDPELKSNIEASEDRELGGYLTGICQEIHQRTRDANSIIEQMPERSRSELKGGLLDAVAQILGMTPKTIVEAILRGLSDELSLEEKKTLMQNMANTLEAEATINVKGAISSRTRTTN